MIKNKIYLNGHEFINAFVLGEDKIDISSCDITINGEDFKVNIESLREILVKLRFGDEYWLN